MLLTALAAITASQAHTTWIEPLDSGALVIRFGEPGYDYEESPGYLDNLSLPGAWTLGPDATPVALGVTKQSDHFRLESATIETAALGETRFPVFQRGSSPASLPHFYVRWHPVGAPAPASPALTFDILPTAPRPGEYRVCLRGAPLAGALVRVEHLGGGESVELTADADGIIHYTTDTPGLVLMTSNHKESLPGFAAGAAYAVTSHNTALSWLQP